MFVCWKCLNHILSLSLSCKTPQNTPYYQVWGVPIPDFHFCQLPPLPKGHRPSANLRQGEKTLSVIVHSNFL